MRKLAYLGKNKDGDYFKTYSYETKEQMKNEYEFKIVFEDIKEKMVYDCYDENGKLVKTIEGFIKNRLQAYKDGFTLKPRIEEYTIRGALA